MELNIFGRRLRDKTNIIARTKTIPFIWELVLLCSLQYPNLF